MVTREQAGVRLATSYKVSVDDLFLRYLATESLSLEICEAQQADYELLAKADPASTFAG